MTMPNEVARAADELLAALRRTEAFTQYNRLKETVLRDEVNRRLLERFTHAQAALQMAAWRERSRARRTRRSLKS